MSIDGFSLYPLVGELQNELAGGRIDKICQPNRYEIYIYVRQPGQTYVLYISINPQNPMINITKEQPENPSEPPVFCMVLRKQLEGGRIAEVAQFGLDRILTIDIDTIGARGVLITKTLVIELMGKYSNLILMQDGRIIDAFRRVGENSNRVRTVLPGHEYEIPPIQDELNILTTDIEEFMSVMQETKDETVFKALLMTGLGFGPVTVREILVEAKVADDILMTDITSEQLDSIKSALIKLKTSFLENKLSPTMVIDNQNKIKAMAPFKLNFYAPDKFEVLAYENYNDMLEASKGFAPMPKMPNQEAYAKIIKNEQNRLTKKIKVLGKELVKAQDAESEKIKADNLMTYQYMFKDHEDAKITVNNIYSETGETLDIPLDKKLTIMQNVQSYYKKYDKLKRSTVMIQEQIDIAKRDLIYAGSIENSLDVATTLPELEDIKQEMIVARFLPPESKKKASMASSKPWHYTLPNGMELWVGKNNYQNDKLSFKVARNEDIWLHTKDIPGSHVIIVTEGQEVDDYNLGLAAQIAIYYSKARESTNVQVDYVQKKFLKKPSGAKPGYVIFTNNRTIFATVDEEQIYPIIGKAL